MDEPKWRTWWILPGSYRNEGRCFSTKEELENSVHEPIQVIELEVVRELVEILKEGSDGKTRLVVTPWRVRVTEALSRLPKNLLE